MLQFDANANIDASVNEALIARVIVIILLFCS